MWGALPRLSRCLDAGIFLGLFRVSVLEDWRPARPHLRLHLIAEHTPKDIENAIKIIIREFRAQS